MARLTIKMETELNSIHAARVGLPVPLASFIDLSIASLRENVEQWPYQYTRARLQSYIDTLRDLIDTKVHSK